MRRIIGTAVVVLFALAAPSAAQAGGHGYGHDRQDVCHGPGTPAEHTLSLPGPAVQAHLRHGDYLGACKPQTAPPPKPPCPGAECRKPYPCPCPLAPPATCPPTQTTVTVIDRVTVTDNGLPAPPPSTAPVPCRQVRSLLFFSPNGMLGRTVVKVGRRVVAVRNPRYRRSALRIKHISVAGPGARARLTIESTVRRGKRTMLFRWSGTVRRCGGEWIVVDPVLKARPSRSSWS